MYPRNAAAPPPLPAVVVPAMDGGEIESDVAAYVDGVPGAGTLQYVANSGWVYTPTQGETAAATFSVRFLHANAIAGGPVLGVATTPQDADGAVLATGNTSDGANTITVSVVDGEGAALESARVRLTKGASAPIATTLADGSATINVDDGTWTLAATLPGYQYDSATLDGDPVVDRAVPVMGDHTLAVVMALNTGIPVSPPNTISAYYFCERKGVARVGVVIGLQQEEPGEDDGVWYDGEERTATSDADGIAAFEGVHPGATYYVREGQSVERKKVTIPTDAAGPYPLDKAVGPA